MWVRRYIATGWFDGPEEGWLEGDDGETYAFHFIARKVLEEWDEKLFLLERLQFPFQEVYDSFARHQEPPDRPFWWPIWQFGSEDKRIAANEMVRDLERRSFPVARFLVLDEHEFE